MSRFFFDTKYFYQVTKIAFDFFNFKVIGSKVAELLHCIILHVNYTSQLPLSTSSERSNSHFMITFHIELFLLAMVLINPL